MATHPTAEPTTDDPASELSWSFQPWQANWRRPALALALCFAVAILGGWAFTMPPKVMPPTTADDSSSAEAAPLATSEVEAGEVATAELDAAQKPGQAWKDARENLPWEVHWFWWSFASLLLLLGMTAPVYCTAKYQLDNQGITVRFMGKRSFRKWQQYRNYYPHPTGVHVTTLPTPSRLDAFRGHYLQFSMPDAEGKTNRAEVLDYLARQITLKGVPESEAPRN